MAVAVSMSGSFSVSIERENFRGKKRAVIAVADYKNAECEKYDRKCGHVLHCHCEAQRPKQSCFKIAASPTGSSQ